MSSADFQKVLVVDDRLKCTDEMKYAVYKGGQNVTIFKSPAVSTSTSSQNYTVQLPSQETVVGRRVKWQSTVQLAFTVYNNSLVAVAPLNILGYGGNGTSGNATALAPFPLHSLMTTLQATINNDNVTVNIADIMPFLMRMYDKRELMRLNSACPSMYDSYLNYSDANGANNNPLGNFSTTSDVDIVYRGSFPVEFFDDATFTTPLVNTPIASTASKTIYMRFTSVEPLHLSPFSWTSPKYNSQGFYGLQTMTFVFNCMAKLNRVLRTTLPQVPSVLPPAADNLFYISDVTFAGTGFNQGSSQLIFEYLSPHPSLILTSRNVVPYIDLPRFFTQVDAIPVATNYSSTTMITSQNIQLNQIPDMLAIMVSKVQGTRNSQDSDSFLPIRGIAVNWNNGAGILSSADPVTLFEMSVNNGSNQTWLEFYGYANTAASTVGTIKPTCGSILLLKMGKDIQLSEDWSAAGVLGTYQLQFNINVHNNTGRNIQANEYQIMVIPVNSGLYVTDRGTSARFTGILSRQDVLDANKQEPYSHNDVQRFIGGGFFGNLKALASKVGNVASAVAPMAKNLLANSGDDRAQKAASVLGALGYGASGGGASGGGASGGGASGGRRKDNRL